MKTDNSVIFKGRKNGITIVLDKNVDFDILKNTLREKMKDAQSFFGDAKTAISFSGRTLSEIEEAELLEIISLTTELSISFLADSEKEQAPRVPKKREQKNEIKENLTEEENLTIFHRGSLRSGQSIRFVGSVVVIGDINPGAEIVAEGNVIVMGTIKGLVHAGCSGNENCFISALSLQPTQLRISDIISFIPRDLSGKNKNYPSYAYAENGQIFIVPLSTQ